MASPGLFVNISNPRERSFFLAQAFTPGNRESNGFFSPLQGACAPTSGEAPWKGATQRVGLIQPRRKPGLFMNVRKTRWSKRCQAAPVAVPLFSSPGLQAGVSGAIYFTGCFSSLPVFGFSPR